MHSEYFVHYRPLGNKFNGMYMNTPWSDVTIQNVAKETTNNLQKQNENIRHFINGSNRRITEYESTIINPRVMDDTIIQTTSEIRGKDTKNFVKGYRKRPIPKGKKSNYVTKPKGKKPNRKKSSLIV